MTTKQSEPNFVIDCEIRGSEIKDLVYSLMSTDEEFTHKYSQQNTRQESYKYLHKELGANINKQVTIINNSTSYSIEKVYYHNRFGWVVSSKVGRAYLGKLSSFLSMKVEIGIMSYFSGSLNLLGQHPLKIGSFCSIGTNLYATTTVHTHPSNTASTYNFGGNARIVEEGLSFGDGFDLTDSTKNGITIGNDVYIGKDVSIMNGVTLGDGCVVGMNSLVTKDLKSYGIYAGAPAKLIRYRFSSEIIKQMNALKWWDWSWDTLKKNSEFFQTDLTRYTGDLKEIIKS